MKTEKRVIKFRAWTGEKMITPAAIGEFGEWYETGRHYEDGRGDREGLMQFTGLLDKNGKEIYEGDVIRYKLAAGLGQPESGVRESVVKFSPYGFFTPYYTDIRVVGNVYDNAEYQSMQSELTNHA